MKRIRGIVIVACAIGLLTLLLLGRQSSTALAIGIISDSTKTVGVGLIVPMPTFFTFFLQNHVV